MKKVRWLTLAFVVIVLLVLTGSALANSSNVYQAELKGMGTGSTAIGQALFVFSSDGQSLRYKVGIVGLNNTTQAHIHIADVPGGNGPVAVWLYPDSPPPILIPGIFTGLLARRSVTSADFVGPLAGLTMDDLKQFILEGRAYVNVHTIQFPAGEIRGDIHAVEK